MVNIDIKSVNFDQCAYESRSRGFESPRAHHTDGVQNAPIALCYRRILLSAFSPCIIKRIKGVEPSRLGFFHSLTSYGIISPNYLYADANTYLKDWSEGNL